MVGARNRGLAGGSASGCRPHPVPAGSVSWSGFWRARGNFVIVCCPCVRGLQFRIRVDVPYQVLAGVTGNWPGGMAHCRRGALQNAGIADLGCRGGDCRHRARAGLAATEHRAAGSAPLTASDLSTRMVAGAVLTLSSLRCHRQLARRGADCWPCFRYSGSCCRSRLIARMVPTSSFRYCAEWFWQVFFCSFLLVPEFHAATAVKSCRLP